GKAAPEARDRDRDRVPATALRALSLGRCRAARRERSAASDPAGRRDLAQLRGQIPGADAPYRSRAHGFLLPHGIRRRSSRGVRATAPRLQSGRHHTLRTPRRSGARVGDGGRDHGRLEPWRAAPQFLPRGHMGTEGSRRARARGRPGVAWRVSAATATTSPPFDAAALERKLRGMWASPAGEPEARAGATYHAAMCNLVVACNPAAHARTMPVLVEVTRRHPSRLF